MAPVDQHQVASAFAVDLVQLSKCDDSDGNFEAGGFVHGSWVARSRCGTADEWWPVPSVTEGAGGYMHAL